MKWQTIGKTFNPEIGGIFSALTTLGDVPWSDMWTAEDLDTVYYFEQSGGKIISAFYEQLLDAEHTDRDTATVLERAARIIKSRYGLKWVKLWATTQETYNPVYNSNMIETHDLRDVNSGTDRHQTRQVSNAQSDVFAFNNTSATPATFSGGAGHGEQTTTHGMSVAHTGTFRREGNIGVTTTQQMLQSERELWMWDIMQTIFHDVDRVLATMVYA